MTQPEDPRRQPRQARSKFTVDAILEAATRVFDQHGYDFATTNRVAETAGVSIGSLYQYFPNKDALLTALHERHVEQVLGEVQAALRSSRGEPLSVALRTLVQQVLALHRETPRLQRVLHTERPWLERPATDSAAAQRLFTATRDWLAAHREEVTVAGLDVAAVTVLRLVESLVHAAVLDPAPGADDAALVDAIAEAALGYLVLAR